MRQIGLADGLTFRRLTRRAIVRGSALAAAATGVTSLVGCAAGSPALVPTAAVTAPTAAAAAATPSAKFGGTLKVSTQTETPHLDPHQTPSPVLTVLGPGVVYSKLIQYRSDVPPGNLVPTTGLAESREQPD